MEPPGDSPAGAAPAAGPADIDTLFERLQSPGVDSGAVLAELADRWSRSGSASMDLLLARGREALDRQDTDAAIGFLTALVDHDPDYAQGYATRAMAYYTAGLTGPALADLQSALALEPRHVEALSGLATILEEVSSPEEALAAWRLLARLTPHDPEVKQALERLDQGPRGTPL